MSGNRAGKQRTGGVGFRIDRTERRSDGALDVQGYLTKTGIYNYTREGQTVRELRSDAEVFSEASLDSLQGSFVTVDHPQDFLEIDSWRDVTVGVVSHVKAEPPYVAGKMRIWDSETIHMIDQGHLKEISCGYACVPMPVERDDADILQTNIRFNHVAIGPEKWGRLGSDVSLRLDSNGQEIVTPIKAINTKDNKMEEINEALAPVLDALKGLEAKYDSLKETFEAKQEEKETEDSPIQKSAVLPEADEIQELVQKQARELVAVELKARDAADEIFGWRRDKNTGRHVRNETYRIDPVICARRLCQDVLNTVDHDVTIRDDEDITPYIRETELLAKRARLDRLAELSTKDSIQTQLSGVRAHMLQTPKSGIRAHIFGNNEG